jgi:tetratricopeptide (TPR) repeat protein
VGSSEKPTSEVLSQTIDTIDPNVTISDARSSADDQGIDSDVSRNEHEIDLKTEFNEDISDTTASLNMQNQENLNVQSLENKDKDAENIIIAADKSENVTADDSESDRESDVSKLPTHEPMMNITHSESHNNNSALLEPLIRSNSTVEDILNNDDAANLTVKESEKLGSEESKENISADTLILQPLFQPDTIIPEEVCQTSLSYIKMADAYMQNGNFKAASKQFLKVLKKTTYSHIPALLGYATSLERLDSSNTAIAYANVTSQALIQDMKPLATASLQRAIASAQNMNDEKLKTLRHLLTVCFTNKFAADVQFEIGQELTKISAEPDQIADAFMRANAYSTLDGGPVHASSLLELAKIALANERYESSLSYIKSAMTQNLGSREVEALVYLGRTKESLADSEGAMIAFKKAIELPLSDASADAYYYFGLHQKANGGNVDEFKGYIEKALNLGFGLTVEATEILGEHNMSVIKSAHRAEWQRYQDMAKQQEERGGIMSGANISGNSIFSHQETSNTEDALTMLEQGAASYDGSSIPTGDNDDTGGKVNPALSRSKVA